MQTVASRNNNTGRVNLVQNPASVAQTGTNLMTGGRNRPKTKTGVRAPPALDLTGRHSPYLSMMMDPVHAEPALPPITLPTRAIPCKQYQERLLTTDANGQAALLINPTMANQTSVASTWTGTTVATWASGLSNTEYTSFAANFLHYIPLVVEVVVKYTGSSNAVAGRLYGIVGAGGGGSTVPYPDLTACPLEPNGCEEVTADGISCTWYATSPVWNNPIRSDVTFPDPQWMDGSIVVGIVGGPASATNILTVGIYFHFAAMPKNGICGLTPIAALPDPSAEMAAALMQAAHHGVGASSVSAKIRDKLRHSAPKIKDLLKIGRNVMQVMPALSRAASPEEALELLLLL